MWAIQAKETRPLNWMVTDGNASFVLVPRVSPVLGSSGWAIARMLTREILGSGRNCIGNVGLWWTSCMEHGGILYMFVKRRLRCVETTLMELLCMCLESPAYLLNLNPGMHCPLACSLGSNIFLASLHNSNFATKWLTQKLSCNLVTVISAAHDLNEHGGKHRLLQTSSQPMSERFWNSVNVWNHPVSLTWKNGRFL